MRPTGRRLRLPVGPRIWLLTATTTAVAIPMAWRVSDGTGYLSWLSLPWWALALMYATAELAVVHLYFHRDAHSFSMTETALIIGLLFASPRTLVFAQFLGCGAALVYRRQSPMKLCFNLANFLLGTSCALAVFHLLAPVRPHLGALVWAAAFASTLVSGLLNGALVVVAISLTESRIDVRRLPMVLVLALAGALTNASLALVAAMLWRTDGLAVVLLAVPAVTVYLAYRAYLREREKHESLEFLYHSTRILNETPEVEAALGRLLQQARGMFHAESAEVLLMTPGNELVLRTAVDAGGNASPMQPVSGETQRLWERMSAGPRSCIALRSPEADPVLQEFLESERLRDAMVGLLCGEASPFGLIVVGNRLGEVTSFDLEDLRLFETLANHASVALENGRLEQSLAQLRALEEQLKRLAYHDPLTGLANRSLFADRVGAALTRSDGRDAECAVLFIDLDDFKTVNDTLGHAAGDQLLCSVGDRLASCVRPEDTAARLGGDEFAVLLEDINGPADAEAIARRVTESLQRPVPCGGQEVPVRASIGIAHGGATTTADELLRNADLAMYMAKSEGKGSYKLFETGMQAEVAHRHELKANLARAVEHGEFAVFYQPIIDLHSELPVSLEALVRWQHPERGLLPPESFVPMAEETGLITTIGRGVLRTACRQAAQWQQEFPLPRPLGISVNLSPMQVRLPELVADVADALADSRLAVGSLCLEITEGLVIDDADTTFDRLHRLRALGVRLALDDFGTGYSSLNRLRRLPIDVLKLAKTFVDDIDADTDTGGPGSAFASAILALGHTLGLTTLAEGLEHPWQVAEMRRLGCTLGQGYHFAKPMTAEETRDYLHRVTSNGGELAKVIRLPA